MASLNVAETFTSIQGESSYAGCSCFFVRLAGCNLQCAYCDTPRARDGGTTRAVQDLLDERQLSPAAITEVTGGEPLLQPATPALLAALHDRTRKPVLLETNGTIDISPVPEGIVTVMDIKTPGSGHEDSVLWSNVERLRPQDEVKFVICDRHDYDWSCRIVRQYELDERCHAVLFSPVVDRLPPETLARWLLANPLPVRLHLQLHKILRIP